MEYRSIVMVLVKFWEFSHSQPEYREMEMSGVYALGKGWSGYKLQIIGKFDEIIYEWRDSKC